MDELIADLDTGTFAKVDGFAVQLFQRANLPGHVLRFVDGGDAVLAEFSWWDHVEVTLRGWTLDDIPLGTPEEPFRDLDQCWLLLIWRDGDDVLIAETDVPGVPGFERQSRVPASDYFDAWKAALTWARATDSR
ncbi:hypothetical protein ACFQ05_36270 [Amycolatopsis umgeniensis]|uniref:Uncharacterized protein n=1 Tax=Amycolatopsis umgeniensis TaxID=336628 RepID=A0A841B9J7_9PSEU|nr:hypothetical protein [Amycolatopsis umgeniensis]MBB5855581.1 hypothetical protein [Amycolatopsis umgeniensis]